MFTRFLEDDALKLHHNNFVCFYCFSSHMTVERMLNVTRKIQQVIIFRPQGQSRAQTSHVRDTLVQRGGWGVCEHGNQVRMRACWFPLTGRMRTFGNSL